MQEEVRRVHPLDDGGSDIMTDAIASDQTAIESPRTMIGIITGVLLG